MKNEDAEEERLEMGCFEAGLSWRTLQDSYTGESTEVFHAL